MKNYIAFFSENYEFETFETYEQAEKWLRDWYVEGFPQESMDGKDYIAKITHRSKFTETDNKKNYKYVYEDDIPIDDENSEAWPHSSEFDVVGNLTFEPMQPSSLLDEVVRLRDDLQNIIDFNRGELEKSVKSTASNGVILNIIKKLTQIINNAKS